MNNDDQTEEDEWTFVHVSDIHVGSPRSYRFQPAWNENWTTARQQIVELQPDFLLVGGDLTRDGDTHREELVAIKNDLDNLPFPAYVIPGNHEVGNKYLVDSAVSINPKSLDTYESVFGPSEWTFVHRDIRFSGLNAFLLGTGFARESVLRDWLESQAHLPTDQAHVWIMHPALFIDSLNEPDFHPVDDRTPWYFGMDTEERAYLFDIFQRTGARHVISGHIHCRRTVSQGRITFHFAPSTAFSQWGDRWGDGDDSLGFLRFTVKSNRIDAEFVHLEQRSRASGYGPGGNPSLAERDYSLAWDQPPFKPE